MEDLWKKEVRYLRQEFTPDQLSKEAIQYYLSRTTYLWNYLVEMTQAAYEDYLYAINRPGNDTTVEIQNLLLEKEVMKWFDYVYSEDYTKHVPERWVEFIDRVREIPPGMSEQRARELIMAYTSSALEQGDNPNRVRRPRRKTARSSQSAYFSPQYIGYRDGKAFLEAGDGAGIELPLTMLLRQVPDAVDSDRITGITVIKQLQPEAKQNATADEFGPLPDDRFSMTINYKTA